MNNVKENFTKSRSPSKTIGPKINIYVFDGFKEKKLQEIQCPKPQLN